MVSPNVVRTQIDERNKNTIVHDGIAQVHKIAYHLVHASRLANNIGRMDVERNAYQLIDVKITED